jgi:hypothetical protein
LVRGDPVARGADWMCCMRFRGFVEEGLNVWFHKKLAIAVDVVQLAPGFMPHGLFSGGRIMTVECFISVRPSYLPFFPYFKDPFRLPSKACAFLLSLDWRRSSVRSFLNRAPFEAKSAVE